MPSIRKESLATIFVFYLVVVAAITIFPTHLSRFRVPYPNDIGLVPLGYSCECFRLAYGTQPTVKAFCFRNTLGNLALLLPLGILLPLVSQRFLTLKRVLLLALCLSLSIETIQFVLWFFGNARTVDIDDVILNTLGAGLGFAFYQFFIAKSEDRIQDREVRNEKRSSDS